MTQENQAHWGSKFSVVISAIAALVAWQEGASVLGIAAALVIGFVIAAVISGVFLRNLASRNKQPSENAAGSSAAAAAGPNFDKPKSASISNSDNESQSVHGSQTNSRKEDDLRRAVVNGESSAMVELSDLLVAKDPKSAEAVELLHQAAAVGESWAWIMLGYAAMRGDQGEPEPSRAVECFNEAHKLGSSTATYWLAKTLIDHPEVKHDGPSPDELLEAIPADDLDMGPESRILLADYLLSDKATERDVATAVACLEQAAPTRAFAAYRLGNLYFDGDGVPQDYVLAKKWLKIAAEKTIDYPFSNWLYDLGRLLKEMGEFSEAHLWLNIAGMSSDSNVEQRRNIRALRDEVASKLKPADLRKAQRLATLMVKPMHELSTDESMELFELQADVAMALPQS